jgi:signal transduction histidine kinase
LLSYLKFIGRFTISCLLVSTISAHLFSQNANKIDSLKNILKQTNDTSRFEILQELFKSYNQTDFTAALQYAQEAYQFAESIGDSSKIVEGGRMIAYALVDLGKNDESIIMLNKVLAMAKRNQDRYPDIKPKIKFLLNNAAISYMYRGNYDSSLSYHFQSLEIREAEGNKRSIGTALNNIGLVYFKLRNFDQALHYYLRTMDIKKQINDSTDIDKVLLNVGLCYDQLDKPNEAIASFNRALASCAGGCTEVVKKEGLFGLGIAYFNLGKLDNTKEKELLEDFKKSEEYLKSSLAISKNLNDKQFWIGNLIWLAKIEVERKDFTAALNYLNEARQFEKESEFAESLIDWYKEMSNVYTSLSDFKNASVYQSKYIALKDSIYSSNLMKNLATVQTSFEQRENLKTIKEKNSILQLQEELIRRQNIQNFFILLVAVLVSGIAYLLVRANRRQKRDNAALNAAKQIITEQNEKLQRANEYLDHQVAEKTQDLFMTNEALIQVNDELDNFIYRTSHDIRGPLVTLKGVCNVAMLDVKDSIALDYLKKLDTTSIKLNTILTRLLIVSKINLWEHVPKEIDCADLIKSMVEAAKLNGLPNNLSFDYEIDPSVQLITDRYLIGIVVENLIDNAIKFHNDSVRISPFVKITVSHVAGNKIKICVIDNGIGVNPTDKDNLFHLFTRASDRSATGGIGLYLSKMAANKLGGEVILATTSSNGSEFHLILPADINPVIEKQKQVEEQRKKEREMRIQTFAQKKEIKTL